MEQNNNRNIKWVSSPEVTDPTVKNWLELNESFPIESLIKNVTTEVKCVSLNDQYYLPVTVNNTEWANSYVVSPYNAYVLYAAEELKRKVKHKALHLLLMPMISLLGIYLRWTAINKVVHVNNFILSTNPYPAWDGALIDEVRDFIKKQFPEHLIIFRSLNELQHAQILERAQRSGFINIASRQVYMYDLSPEDWNSHNNNYQDKRMIARQQLLYLSHEAMEPYLEEALALYNLLYLDKYSRHNPQFTLDYFRECYRHKLMHFQGYKNDQNQLKAFAGLFVYSGTITSPLVGYDTLAPQKEALYIHAIRLIFDYKFKSGYVLNLSSGAPEFKRNRGGKAFIEYSSIYSAHLKMRTRVMIRILAFVSNKIGKPLLKKYEL